MLKIFKISTASLTVNTASVIYSINCKCWNNLPCEGFILLQINQSAPATADALPVSISTTNKVNTDTVTTFASALINGAGDPVTSADLTQGNRYFIYFNKCDGTFQMVNFIPATT
jgi:hypothetical protein